MDEAGFVTLGSCDCICHRSMGLAVHHVVACCGYVIRDGHIQSQDAVELESHA